MQKPSSNPLRKTVSNISKPMIPITVSLIFSPEDFYDIAEQYKGLKKRRSANSIDNRIERDMARWCYLTGPGCFCG
jgi:hypothetical protein